MFSAPHGAVHRYADQKLRTSSSEGGGVLGGPVAVQLLQRLHEANHLLQDGPPHRRHTKVGRMPMFATTDRVVTTVHETIRVCDGAIASSSRLHAASTYSRWSSTSFSVGWEDVLPVCMQLANLAYFILQHGVVEPLLFLTPHDDVSVSPSARFVGGAAPIKDMSPQECAARALRCYEEIQRLALHTTKAATVSSSSSVAHQQQRAAAGGSSAIATAGVVSRDMQLYRLVFTVEYNALLWSRLCRASTAALAVEAQRRADAAAAVADDGGGASVNDFTGDDAATVNGRQVGHVVGSSSSLSILSLPTHLVCEELVLHDLAHVEPARVRSSVVTGFVWDVLDCNGDGAVDIADVLVASPLTSLVQMLEADVAAAAAVEGDTTDMGDGGVDEAAAEEDPHSRCGSCDRLEAELLLARREIDTLKALVAKQQRQLHAVTATAAVKAPTTVQPRYATPTGNAARRGSAHQQQQQHRVAPPRTATVDLSHYTSQDGAPIGGGRSSTDRELARFDRLIHYSHNNINMPAAASVHEETTLGGAYRDIPEVVSRHHQQHEHHPARYHVPPHNDVEALWGALEEVIYTSSPTRNHLPDTTTTSSNPLKTTSHSASTALPDAINHHRSGAEEQQQQQQRLLRRPLVTIQDDAAHEVFAKISPIRATGPTRHLQSTSAVKSGGGGDAPEPPAMSARQQRLQMLYDEDDD